MGFENSKKENAQGYEAGERRLFERLSAKFPTRFKDSSRDYGVDVFLRDFSGSGVRVHTHERYFVDDMLAIEVELPDGKDPVALNGRVCWASSQAPSLWNVGIEVHKVNLFKLHRLVEFSSKVEGVRA